jgi:uncharacterized protein GlcG (DUF336 family)
VKLFIGPLIPGEGGDPPHAADGRRLHRAEHIMAATLFGLTPALPPVSSPLPRALAEANLDGQPPRLVKGATMKAFGLALVIVLLAGTAASAQMMDKKVLTLAAAKKIAAAAEQTASQNKWSVVIAIVDEGGHLVYLSRVDGTQYGSVDVAIRKAGAAAAFKRPTKVFEDAVAGGRMALLGLEAAVPLEGGVPLVLDGNVIGAIGVSGVTAQQDGVVAKAGADAVAGAAAGQ